MSGDVEVLVAIALSLAGLEEENVLDQSVEMSAAVAVKMTVATYNTYQLAT